MKKGDTLQSQRKEADEQTEEIRSLRQSLKTLEGDLQTCRQQRGQALYDLGVARTNLLRYDDAMTVLREILSLFPSNAVLNAEDDQERTGNRRYAPSRNPPARDLKRWRLVLP